MAARIVLAATLLAATSSVSLATEPAFTLQETLVIAKVTGACGVLKSMTNFQDLMNLEGGEEFIARFAMFEAARLGHDVQEYLRLCEKNIAAYKATMEALR